MTDPFDDPELKAELAQMGIVHKPGMGAEMMNEMAPLLAAEGIDLDDPNTFTMDSLDAAMKSATERRNLELFTPVGRQRQLALADLREFCDAFNAGKIELAEDIVFDIPSDPEPDAASTAQVMGVGLGLLDEWLSAPENSLSLRVVRVPKWRKTPRKIATDLIVLARKGRAAGSLDSFIVRHGGEVLMHGIVLAVAAVMSAFAQAEGIPGAEVTARQLFKRSDIEPSPDGVRDSKDRRDSNITPISAAKGRKAQPPASRGSGYFSEGMPLDARAEKDLLVEFGQFAEQNLELMREDAEIGVENLSRVLGLARDLGLDVRRPDQVIELLDAIIEVGVGGDSHLPVVMVIDEYVEFRLASAGTFENWQAVRERIVDELVEIEREGESALEEILAEVTAEIKVISPEEFSAWTRDLVVVSAVGELLAWIGQSRPITSAGWLRRKDIVAAAKLLGISAVGVTGTSDDPHGKSDGVVRVQSMGEIAELAVWWSALSEIGVLELKSTVVKPGPRADLWVRDGSVAPEGVIGLIDSILTQILMDPPGHTLFVEPEVRADLLLTRLVMILQGDEAIPESAGEAEAAPGEAGAFGEGGFDLVKGLTAYPLSCLRGLGLVTGSEAEGLIIPPVIRPLMAGAIINADAARNRAEN